MADFWAGYLSGVAGIIIGSPLDIIKTRSQSRISTSTSSWYQSPSSLLRGTAAPILSNGAINALLFYSYNRSLLLLGARDTSKLHNEPLWKVFIGGAVSGIACFVVTTPTEVIKCRVQVGNHQSSYGVVRELYRAYGPIRGFYLGGGITSLRDAIGYGFYFWTYECAKRYLPIDRTGVPENSWVPEINTLLCGGIAGCMGWATIYPLDVVKTMVQVQAIHGRSGAGRGESQEILGGRTPTGTATSPSRVGGYDPPGEFGAWECAKKAYRDGGVKVFWNGISACLGRAFIVNAVTFFVYEWAMEKLIGTGLMGKTEYEYVSNSSM